MNFEQGDVVILPVPFSDQSARKARPAVVVSNNRINSASDDVVLVPLTSVLKDSPYSVLITDRDLEQGKLAAPSRARADKIFTAHKDLIAMKIGIVRSNVMAEIKQEIMNAL